MMGTYHVTNLYTCFITVLSLEHNTKSKMNFIGTAKTRIQVQNLLEDFDSPKKGKKNKRRKTILLQAMTLSGQLQYRISSNQRESPYQATWLWRASY